MDSQIPKRDKEQSVSNVVTPTQIFISVIPPLEYLSNALFSSHNTDFNLTNVSGKFLRITAPPRREIPRQLTKPNCS